MTTPREYKKIFLLLYYYSYDVTGGGLNSL